VQLRALSCLPRSARVRESRARRMNFVVTRLESLSKREWQTVHVTRSPLIGWGDQSSIEPITDPRKG